MAEIQLNSLPVAVSETDHARGPAQAPITVVKYGDYECPDCRGMHRLLLKSTRPLEDTVRYVFRHFPLVGVHPHALRAAEAAEAAAAQGKFWGMHDLLFSNPDRLRDPDLRRYAREAGLEMKKFDQDMEEKVYAQAIMRERERSIIHGISGTPTFYLNEELFLGSGEMLLERVKALLAGDRKLG